MILGPAGKLAACVGHGLDGLPRFFILERCDYGIERRIKGFFVDYKASEHILGIRAGYERYALHFGRAERIKGTKNGYVFIFLPDDGFEDLAYCRNLDVPTVLAIRRYRLFAYRRKGTGYSLYVFVHK